MASFWDDHPDLRFYLERAFDWDRMFELTERGYSGPDGYRDAAEARETWADILSMVGAFVAEEVAPHALEIDGQGVLFEDGQAIFPPRLEAICRQIEDLGLHGMTVPRELGGLNCPLLVYFMVAEMMARADVSTTAHFSFHGGIAMALLVYSIYEGSTEFDAERGIISKTRFPEAIAEIISGETWGSMDITEPDAGSDMASLRCRGWQDEEGRWRVAGQKVFITSGHGRYHVVIARTEEAAGDDPFAGLAGLSLFMVPAWSLDEAGDKVHHVTVDRLEDKLGHHGSATCSLTFHDAPAELLGRRGEGFRGMLLLMNNARVGVAIESLGIAEAAHRLARDYAAERRSMGKTIDRHEMIADMLDEMDGDIRGIRALTMTAAWHEEVGRKLELLRIAAERSGEPVDPAWEREHKEHARISRRLTPMAKFLASEKSVEISRKAIQILGGVGYVREYGAGKLLRDALVMPIYEGTSQIQSLMVMKDTLTGILRRPQEFLRRVAEHRLQAVRARDPLERQLHRLHVVSLSAQQSLVLRTAATKLRAVASRPLGEWLPTIRAWDPKRDFSRAMLHAERLTQLLADEAIAEILWDQAQRFPERRELVERHLERAEPRARYLLDRITSTGERLLEELAEAEGGQDVAA